MRPGRVSQSLTTSAGPLHYSSAHMHGIPFRGGGGSMWSFRWRSIFWVGLGMVSTVALACGTTTAADAPRSLPDDNPLQRHRQGLGPERVAGQAVQGVVTAVHAGQIVTSIEWAEVRARDIHDGDL